MRNRSRSALAVVLPVLSLALTGCFELKEEIWFNKDGTGRLTVSVGMDQKMHDERSDAKKKKDEEKTKKQKEAIEKNPNVTKCEISTKSENGMYYETTDISLKDVSKLPETLKEFQQGLEASEDVLTVKKLDDGNYEFFQTFGKKKPPEKEPTPEEKKIGDDITAKLAKELGDHKLTVVVHGEGFGATNGTAAEKSVTWAYKLADLMIDDRATTQRKSVELKAVVKVK
jgi:hypothetical protein